MPAAIAAQLAHPDRTVLSVADDGCFLMCGQELATAVRHRAAVVFVVVDRAADPDVAAYARAFGIQTETAVSAGEIVAAVERAAGAGVPAVVQVPAGPEAPAAHAAVLQASA